MRLRVVVANVAAAMVMAAIAACSSSQSTPPPSSTAPAGGNVFASMLGKARADSVSDAQIAALEKAAKSGEMSYAEVSALVEDMYQCFDAAGVHYLRNPDNEPYPGFNVPNFGYADAQLAVADTCQNKYAYFALNAYQTQPRAGELADAALEGERPEVLACLREHGVAIDDKATLDELRRASQDLMSTSNASPGGTVVCSKYPFDPTQ